MMIDKRVVVVGGDHHNTLGVIRSLGHVGVRSDVICITNKDDAFVIHSKYVHSFVLIKSDSDIIEALGKLKQDGHYLNHPVVIACSDGSACTIDQNKNNLQYFFLPGVMDGSEGGLHHYMNKETMSNLASSLGLNVPASWVVSSEKDPMIDSIEYPCITKPMLSKDGSKSDILVCNDKESLQELLKKGSCSQYQVQKYLDKDFEYQLIGLSLNKGNEIIIPGVSHCIRPCQGTNTGFLHYESLEGIHAPVDKCKEFIKTIGYQGLFSIEFLRDKSGEDYFLEMNFRNDGNAISVTAAGVNLPYIWYLYHMKQDYKEWASRAIKEVYVMPIFFDLGWVKHGRLSLYNWVKDFLRTDCYMEFDKHDIMPFLYKLKNYLVR